MEAELVVVVDLWRVRREFIHRPLSVTLTLVLLEALGVLRMIGVADT